MSPPPARPKIYHITHVDNLRSILTDGGLWSDAELIARGGPAASIGMGSIKLRRLRLRVKCHESDCVGDYVPSYFCPRSIMLYLIHCANHPELTYRGGQDPILHLEADLYEVIDWAEGGRRRWAFSQSNAGAVYTEFRNDRNQLSEIEWPTVAATDFRNPQVKEAKQGEFLPYSFFPWQLVQRIGSHSAAIQKRVLRMLAETKHRPSVDVQRGWYY